MHGTSSLTSLCLSFVPYKIRVVIAHTFAVTVRIRLKSSAWHSK